MFCSKCGKPLVYGGSFCRYCGAAAVIATPAAPRPAMAYSATMTGCAPLPAVKNRRNQPVIIVLIAALALLAAFTAWVLLSRPAPAFRDTIDVILIESGSGADTGGGLTVADSGVSGSLGTGNNPESAFTDVPGTGDLGGPVLSAAEPPEPEDFYWYMDEVYTNGIPADAMQVTNFSELVGSWKALFWFDPENSVDSYGMTLLNIDIGGDAGSTTLTCRWYMMYSGSDDEVYDLTGTDDTVMSGFADEYGLTAGVPGAEITLGYFYMLDGRQYAIGIYELQSGEPAYVAMMRP